MTHSYEFKIGDTTFEGEVEFTNAGVIGFTEDGDVKMGGKIFDAVKTVFEQLSMTYPDISDFDKFEINKL